ncbi:TPA: RES family NAD+ phosphorylase [Proteus mirabilis]|uniref:RES family NAD+ phosphorylase n=1 Tax=Proteus mirabilis TaxID=584 RepID=UPI000D748465|nr:RES family NAD+ phosphorylase [Proteus mirabilis]AWR58726.1 hypothetical protein CLH65_04930 [Proteus mirabilis]MDE8641122.1 RES family NAD+ phosphorylase [Proteus mirabilis]HBC6576984.1 RES family NAD+ phosphorylase [Proteus mirabilis]HEK0671318.1 RES family NAD+ phosphorylase [Proteus mirabilis]
MCSDDQHKIWICSSCIKESYLQEKININNNKEKCHYCNNIRACFSLESVGDIVEQAVREHFIRTPTEPSDLEYSMSKCSKYEWERKGDGIDDIIQELLETEDIIAYDIREYIEDKNYIYDSTGEETEFSSESYYIEREKVDTEYLDTIWDNFVSSLQTESRYINHTVKDTLDSIFSGIERMSAGGGQAIIVNSGPGTKIDSLYRARWSNNQATSEQMIVIPDKELGPPPYKFSGFNRMSARGISVFYGASSVSTAISEIRPPVGSEVISAKFRIIRPLKLLNLKALKTAWESGSMLDPDYIMKREQITFLRTLTNKIVNPVLPGEEEFSYIPTQVIAEYLANSPELNLDGILYPSVQQSASDTLSNFNVVLFHKASRVKYLELPAKEECYVNYWQQYDENDDELDICVIQKNELKKTAPLYDSDTKNKDEREPSLEIELKTVEVHTIKSANFNYTSNPVKRRKFITSGSINNQNISNEKCNDLDFDS